MITAKQAMQNSTTRLRDQITEEVLTFIGGKIEEATTKCRFHVSIDLADIDEYSPKKDEMYLIEYLRLLGYNARYFSERIDIKWQI